MPIALFPLSWLPSAFLAAETITSFISFKTKAVINALIDAVDSSEG